MNILKEINKYNIILASSSPRRELLMRDLGIKFNTVKIPEFNEKWPPHLKAEQIPMYLAKQKANHFPKKLSNTDILITADTIVWFGSRVLGKPKNVDEAKKILSELSGNKHIVYTGVHIVFNKQQKSFYARTDVVFRDLLLEEIDHYVHTFKPLDKAGAYGIQEWIGYIGVEKIEGSFYNVMGLPVQHLYNELVEILK